MIISVSYDKNLRFSQLLGGAVGPIVVIDQFESTTGDVNKMMFSTRSKTVEVCKRLLMVSTFRLFFKQSDSSTSPAKQRLAPVAFNILVLTTITSLAFVLYHQQCRGWGHHLNYIKVKIACYQNFPHLLPLHERVRTGGAEAIFLFCIHCQPFFPQTIFSLILSLPT